MEIEVTAARHAHLPQLLELWKDLMDYHATIDPYFERSAEGALHFENFVSGLLLLEDARVVIALDSVSGRAVGYCIAQIVSRPPVFTRREHGFITDMTVAPGLRRMGIGSLLLEHALAWFREKKVDRVELNVLPRNELGYSFWKKKGFKDYMHIVYLENP